MSRKPRGFWHSESAVKVLKEVCEKRMSLKDAADELNATLPVVRWYVYRLKRRQTQEGSVTQEGGETGGTPVESAGDFEIA